jgi:hypothetical protein
MSWLTKQTAGIVTSEKWQERKTEQTKILAAGAEKRCRAVEERKTVMRVAAEGKQAVTTVATKQRLKGAEEKRMSMPVATEENKAKIATMLAAASAKCRAPVARAENDGVMKFLNPSSSSNAHKST